MVRPGGKNPPGVTGGGRLTYYTQKFYCLNFSHKLFKNRIVYVFVHKTHTLSKQKLSRGSKGKSKEEGRSLAHSPRATPGFRCHSPADQAAATACSVAGFSVWKALCFLSRGESPMMERMQERDPIIKMQILSQHSLEIYLHELYFQLRHVSKFLFLFPRNSFTYFFYF